MSREQNSCVYCNKDHMCANCPQVVTIRDRQKILTQKQLCFNCTSNNHKADSCRSGGCHNCQRKRHILICDRSRPNSGRFDSTKQGIGASHLSCSCKWSQVLCTARYWGGQFIYFVCYLGSSWNPTNLRGI